MSSIDDIRIIDKKKNNTDKNNSYYLKLRNFFITLLILLICVFVFFTSSGFVLYCCKIAQSNILPTEIKCMPYEGTLPVFEPKEGITINIFETIFQDPPLSEKIQFPFDKTNFIIETLRDIKSKNTSSVVAYFVSIIESLLCFNYSSFNLIFNSLNRLPEILIITLGPFLISVLTSFLFLINMIYTLYLWFANMGWFFKSRINEKTDWIPVTLLQPIGFGISLFMVFLFSLLSLLIAYFGIPTISSGIILWTLTSIASYKGFFINNDKSKKEVNFGNIILCVFKYYKVLITTIISLFVVISAFSNLGNTSGLFSLIVIALIYFGIFTIDIYNPILRPNLSPLVSYKQAIKTCIKNDTSIKKGIFGMFSSFLPQKGGNRFIYELKKISKKLKD